MFNRFTVRDNFVQDELLGGVADLALLVREIFRCKDIALISFSNQIFGTFK